MSIELVVFDLAGTTVHDNNDVHICLQQALKKAGYKVSIEDANEVMGLPKPDAIRLLLHKHGADKALYEDEAFIDKIHHDFVQAMIEHYQSDPDIKEKTNVSDTFRQLKARGVKVGIDTGFSRDITDAILTRLGWQQNELIDYSVTSDEVANGRPHPDMIHKIMKDSGVSDSQRVAKVGDTRSDLLEGTAANCKYVIGVTTGAYAREDLEKEPHTHLVEHVDEILTFIN